MNSQHAIIGAARHSLAVGAQAQYGSDALVENRQGEVPAALERLDRQLTRCSDLFHKLHERLQGSVVRVAPPEPVDTANAPTSATPMGRTLQNLAGTAAGLADLVESTLERLEA